jgi:hypothetical protein
MISDITFCDKAFVQLLLVSVGYVSSSSIHSLVINKLRTISTVVAFEDNVSNDLVDLLYCRLYTVAIKTVAIFHPLSCVIPITILILDHGPWYTIIPSYPSIFPPLFPLSITLSRRLPSRRDVCRASAMRKRA